MKKVQKELFLIDGEWRSCVWISEDGNMIYYTQINAYPWDLA